MLRRSALKPRKQNAPAPAWKVAEAFKQYLRGRDECACDGRNPHCGGPIIAAHVDYAGKGTRDAKGTGTKAADRWCIPLSDLCHKLQHSKGWPWFDKNILGHAGAAEEIAGDYWHLWPGRIAWERKLADNG